VRPFFLLFQPNASPLAARRAPARRQETQIDPEHEPVLEAVEHDAIPRRRAGQREQHRFSQFEGADPPREPRPEKDRDRDRSIEKGEDVQPGDCDSDRKHVSEAEDELQKTHRSSPKSMINEKDDYR